MSAPDSASDGASSLVTFLQHQSRQRAAAVALRHKKRGIWQEKRWRQVWTETRRLATVLTQAGFSQGDSLLLLSHPRPEALLLSLAAQYLGGVALVLDPDSDRAELAGLLPQLGARHVFAESQTQVDQVLAAHSGGALILYADARGLADYAQAQLCDYGHALAAVGEIECEPQAAPAEAFVFYRLEADGQLARQVLSHEALLSAGQRVVAAERLSAHEQALAARAFAAGAQIRYLLAPWLIAGFCLNFPENIHTRDNDRRELGPTLVAGTRATYGRLAALVEQHLPPPGSALRGLIDAALRPEASWWLRALSYYPLRRPLCDVLGLNRARAPLLIGAPLDEKDQRFFAALGVRVRPWPDSNTWQRQPAHPAHAAAGSALWTAADTQHLDHAR